MKILAAIANYGTKNREFLETVIREYRSMPWPVHITVLSDRPKDLGPGVEVLVGLPTKDPWSLPFGHKRLFAERADDYDLFLYSEDDILVTGRNIQSFLRFTDALPGDRVSGFLRYEIAPSGERWYPDFRDSYHWLPGSASRHGGYTFAEFSNAHAACYALTREQLRRAIASGGFLVAPHAGRYDLLCSAATDPYTQCGMRKVVCISHLSDVLVHHLPNRYAGVYGIGQGDLMRQINHLRAGTGGRNGRGELLVSEKGIESVFWDKVYYGGADEELLAMVPRDARSVLSLGCGFPSLEEALARRGRTVTAVPLDAVVGTLASARGIRVLEPDFASAFRGLEGARFDCVILSDLLQHLERPDAVLRTAAGFLLPGGRIVIGAPNFRYLRTLRDHFPYPLLRRWTYEGHRLRMVGRSGLERLLRSLGLVEITGRYVVDSPRVRKWGGAFGALGPLLASRFLVSAARPASAGGPGAG